MDKTIGNSTFLVLMDKTTDNGYQIYTTNPNFFFFFKIQAIYPSVCFTIIFRGFIGTMNSTHIQN